MAAIGGISLLRVGGKNEKEMLMFKKRFNRAVNLVECARRDGIVAGWGSTYLNCISVLGNYVPNLKYEKIGLDILLTALKTPAIKIVMSAGYSYSESERVLENIVNLRNTNNNLNIGFNLFSEEYVDMFSDGIIEPASLVQNSLENAVSVSFEMLYKG